MIKIIRNILPIEKADELKAAIEHTNGSWWSYAYKHSDDNITMCGNTLAYLKVQEVLNKNLIDRFRSGKFSYRFRRSTNHVSNCTCYECTFRKEYLERSIRNIVISETNLKNPYIQETFISVYSPGDFLSMHTDGERNIAFVLNLTKDWRAEYGGLLHTKNEDETYTAYVPEYNSLLLMDVTADDCPHFVSEVSQYAPSNRIAVSGWYNDPKS